MTSVIIKNKNKNVVRNDWKPPKGYSKTHKARLTGIELVIEGINVESMDRGVIFLFFFFC
jgi:hypothetical protein